MCYLIITFKTNIQYGIFYLTSSTKTNEVVLPLQLIPDVTLVNHMLLDVSIFVSIKSLTLGTGKSSQIAGVLDQIVILDLVQQIIFANLEPYYEVNDGIFDITVV